MLSSMHQVIFNKTLLYHRNRFNKLIYMISVCFYLNFLIIDLNGRQNLFHKLIFLIEDYFLLINYCSENLLISKLA